MYSNPPMDYPYHPPSYHHPWNIPPTYPTNPSFTSPTTSTFPSFPWELFTPCYTHGSSSPKLFLNHGYSPHLPPNPYSSPHYSFYHNTYYEQLQPAKISSTIKRNFEKHLHVSFPGLKKRSRKISPKILLPTSHCRQHKPNLKIIHNLSSLNPPDITVSQSPQSSSQKPIQSITPLSTFRKLPSISSNNNTNSSNPNHPFMASISKAFISTSLILPIESESQYASQEEDEEDDGGEMLSDARVTENLVCDVVGEAESNVVKVEDETQLSSLQLSLHENEEKLQQGHGKQPTSASVENNRFDVAKFGLLSDKGKNMLHLIVGSSLNDLTEFFNSVKPELLESDVTSLLKCLDFSGNWERAFLLCEWVWLNFESRKYYEIGFLDAAHHLFVTIPLLDIPSIYCEMATKILQQLEELVFSDGSINTAIAVDKGKEKSIGTCDTSSNPLRTASEHWKRETCPNFNSAAKPISSISPETDVGAIDVVSSPPSSSVPIRKISSPPSPMPVMQQYDGDPLRTVSGLLLLQHMMSSGGKDYLGALAMLEDSVKKLESPQTSPAVVLQKIQVDSATDYLADWVYESCGSNSFSGLEHPKCRAFLTQLDLPPVLPREFVGSKLDSKFEEVSTNNADGVSTSTLLGFKNYLSSLCSGAEFLLQLVHDAICDVYFEFGASVPASDLVVHGLDYLHKKLEEMCLVQGGEEEAYLNVLYMYVVSLLPYIKGLDSWIFDEILDDPCDEMLVFANKEVYVAEAEFSKKIWYKFFIDTLFQKGSTDLKPTYEDINNGNGDSTGDKVVKEELFLLRSCLQSPVVTVYRKAIGNNGDALKTLNLSRKFCFPLNNVETRTTPLPLVIMQYCLTAYVQKQVQESIINSAHRKIFWFGLSRDKFPVMIIQFKQWDPGVILEP